MQNHDSDLAQSWVPPRRDRVRDHTAYPVNQRIDDLTRASVASSLEGGRDVIQRRLAELDSEWDVDRALMVNFAVAGAVSSSLGFTRYLSSSPFGPRRKGFLYLFGAQLGFLLLHGTLGWCPPVAVFRRLGYRTKAEIDSERALLERALERSASS
jgi:hypothetical protein